MTAKRTYFVMVGVVILLIAICGAGTYFANKMLQKEGNKLLALKLEKAVLDRQSSALAQAKADITEYEELEKIAKTVVPQEKDQAKTVLELVKIAQESGINLTSIEFPESKLGEVIKKGTKPTAAKQQNTVDSNTTQLTELEDLKGVYAMEIKVQSDKEKPISYVQLLEYLKRLEKNRRTAQVIDINIQPSETDRNLVTFSLVLNTYVRP
ncbi:hypothetical protein H0V99_01485 [Candidatus Saccharibacteria bacterium]|nr:hypothetical protein [Candidatus Saccharibacteria bacterium]